ncbi:MAG TPA: hypothetical protein VJ346_05735 [Bacteroidales bacterium]|nr:hypothetical protein [Bacteroidales bacterium]
MKPLYILLFFISVFLILFAIALYFPPDGIALTGNLRLQFFTASDIFREDVIQYADISEIIDQNELLNDSMISALASSADESDEVVVSDTIRANADSLRKSITRIEFPKNDRTILFGVFDALKRVKDKGGLIRIMHYGDSQIEGDRMTALIRNRLQQKFGGHGVGLVPASQLYDFSFSILQESSENWYRYPLYGDRDTTLQHSRYGPFASFCMFTPASVKNAAEDTSNHTAWISFRQSPYSYSNTKTFSQCRIFYGYNKEPFLHEVFLNDILYDADIILPSTKPEEIRWKFDVPQKKIRLVFSGKSSPEIYGIALDPLSGVVVDNIAMRGCAGNYFTSIDAGNLKAIFKKLQVKLFLLQFGGNVVPHVVEDYGYYEKWFCRQIIRIKEVCPGASVIVIGLSDMSVKEKDRFITYPNLEKVRNALKNAAFKADAGYWDMYKAMGGYNSMPSWVFAEPPLAAKDFVHFNPKGADIIAQMFYNAFIYEYNRYENYLVTGQIMRK